MASRPPPLLLTKRLTAFLHLNLHPQHTTALLLLTREGKLLAYATDNPPIPVATLRTHATVAASLYAIHAAERPATVDAALGPAARASTNDSSPLAVTVQLESGAVLVVRRLQCGLLFVCMGPGGENSGAQSQQAQQQQQQQQQHIQPLAGAIQQVSGAENGHMLHTPSTSPPPQHQHHHQSQQVGSPSEVASVLSATSSVAGTSGVMVTRRHAEGLARWLDEKLGGLEIPDGGLGGVV